MNEIKDMSDEDDGEWISVKDRLPEDRETVLWLHDLELRKKHENIFDSPVHIVGYYMEEINSVCLVDLDEDDRWFNIEKFTYWMPLPNPPNGA